MFEKGIDRLFSIESIKKAYLAKPGATEARSIIDNSYDYAIVVFFKDVEAHDAYQVDPLHDEFRELSHLWKSVKIYDSETIW